MNALKEYRKAAGLTQMELAIKVGTTPSRISIWETAPELPCGGSTLRALADALRCSVDDLLGRNGGSGGQT